MARRSLKLMGQDTWGNVKMSSIKKIDEHIGSKVRQRRILLGVSQSELGRALGLTFQQVQKYEKGLSHITVGRLWDIGKILGVPFSFFIEGLDKPMLKDTVFPFTPTLAETREDLSCDPLARHDVRDLIRAYCSISDVNVAKDMLKVIKDLARVYTGENINDDDTEDEDK